MTSSAAGSSASHASAPGSSTGIGSLGAAGSIAAIVPISRPISPASRCPSAPPIAPVGDEVLQRDARHPAVGHAAGRLVEHHGVGDQVAEAATRELHDGDLPPHVSDVSVAGVVEAGGAHDPGRAVGGVDAPCHVVPTGAFERHGDHLAHQRGERAGGVLRPEHGQERTAVPGWAGYG